MAARGGGKDIIELKAEEGRRKANAFISALKAVDRETLDFAELRVTFDVWCAGLLDGWGNNMAVILNGFLDRVEDQGMDPKNLSKAWRVFERALIASVREALAKEDADIRRGFEIRWSEYIDEKSLDRKNTAGAGVSDGRGVQVP